MLLLYALGRRIHHGFVSLYCTNLEMNRVNIIYNIYLLIKNITILLYPLFRFLCKNYHYGLYRI